MRLLEQILSSFFLVLVGGGVFFLFCAIHSSLSPALPKWKKFREALLCGWIFTWPIMWLHLQMGPLFWNLLENSFLNDATPSILFLPVVVMVPATLIIFPLWTLSYMIYILISWGHEEFKIVPRYRFSAFYIIWVLLFPLATAFTSSYHLFTHFQKALAGEYTGKETATLIYFSILTVLIPLAIGSFGLYRVVSSRKKKHILPYPDHGVGHTFKYPLRNAGKRLRPLKGYFTYWK